MGSTEHEDSGMEDILDSIRRIISDEPLENELPQATIAQAPPQVRARAENTPVVPGPSVVPGGAAGPTMAAAALPNANGLNPTPPPAVPAPASSAPANNTNVTSQLANALENRPPQAAPTEPVRPTPAPVNAGPVDAGMHNPIEPNSGDAIMDLTHPVSGPVGVPASQVPAQAPAIVQPTQGQPSTSNAPENNQEPARPMTMRTQVEGPTASPPQTPMPPQEIIQTGEEPAVASMTSQQFNSPTMNGSPAPAQATPSDVAQASQAQASPAQPSPAQASPAQASSPPAAAPAVASGLSREISPTAKPLPSDNKPVWHDDADTETAPQPTEATPKSNGINALNDALDGVSIATPHAQSPAEQVGGGTTAELPPPVIPTVVQPHDQSGEKTDSVDASPAAVLPNEGAERSPTEQAMRDLLKPMIKTWLDDNMPRMVEEVLRDEVRLAAKSDK